ncbi:hypothetical protein HDA40_005780 [Hamadaea flava]|uniref:Lipoprotein n=1 Tax=Hamadaea flava TaxID=1742688 RepID=A0ABV8LTR9_9ACTN|nr:hypothetical protein [Hamadaea flava]MCP2327273.1 hypothetical protein [Hamadaea flava]
MRRWMPMAMAALMVTTSVLTAGCGSTKDPEFTSGQPGLVGSGAGVADVQPSSSAGALSTPAASASAVPPTTGAVVSGATTAPIPAGQPQLVRLGVPVAKWQAEFDRIVAAKYRLVHFDGYEVGSQTFVNALFRPSDGVAWQSRSNLTAAAYQTAFDQFKTQGYRLADVSSYLVAGQLRYAAMWRKASGPVWVAYHGYSQSAHQTKIDALTKEGYHPVAVSVVAPNNTPQWTALYVKENIGSWLAKSWLTLAEYQTQWDAAMAKGMRVSYLSATQYAGSVRISVIFEAGTGAYEARFGLTAADAATKTGSNQSAGRLTRAVAGYAAGSSARFALAWS